MNVTIERVLVLFPAAGACTKGIRIKAGGSAPTLEGSILRGREGVIFLSGLKVHPTLISEKVRKEDYVFDQANFQG